MNIRFYHLLFALTLFTVVIGGTGCMETTLAVGDVENRVRVRATVRNQGSTETLPMQGARMVLLDSTRQRELSSQLTDASGTALLTARNQPVRTVSFVRAEPVGTLQPNPAVTTVAVCEDTTIVVEYLRPVDCQTITAGDSIVFRDPVTFSEEIVRNRPPSIEQCWAFQHTGNAAATFNAPGNIPAPFRLTSITVNGAARPLNAAITMAPGDVVSFCFSVSTATLGDFRQTLQIPIPCPNTAGTVAITLKARIVPERCECLSNTVTLIVEEPVRLGEQSAEIGDVLYDNSNEICDVRLEFVRSTPGTDQRWTATPAIGANVDVRSGATADIRARFRPTQAGSFSDTLFYRTTMANGQVCNVRVVLIGCVLECPKIILQNGDTVALGAIPANRRNDATRSIQPALPCDPGSSTFFNANDGRISYTVVNPSLCADVSVNAELVNFNFAPARDFLVLTNRRVTMGPQGSSNIGIRQENVPIELVRQLAQAQGAGPLEIRAQLRLSTSIPGCDDFINVVFPVDTVPPVSPPNTLIAYRQVINPTKPDPDFTVFLLDPRAGFTAPNTYESFQLGEDRNNAVPQNNGDLYVTVQDNVVDFNTDPRYQNQTGQLPRLHIRNGGRIVAGALWQQMTSTEFSQRTGPTGVLARFAQAVPGLTFNITPAASRQLQANSAEAGNVYAFRVRSGSPDAMGGPCNDVFALVFVRGVDNGFGTFATTTRQSQMQFQVMYPVYGR
jgi:hypothetical protein